MIIIAHRGNVRGPNPKKENKPSYLENALSNGYQAECDVWYDKGWWLGHDKPQYKTDLIWLSITGGLWVHCKNLKAMELLTKQHINVGNCPHFFWHENDKVALTSHGVLWTYPRGKLTSMSVCVLPEIGAYTVKELMKPMGLCTDLCDKYKHEFFKATFKTK